MATDNTTMPLKIGTATRALAPQPPPPAGDLHNMPTVIRRPVNFLVRHADDDRAHILLGHAPMFGMHAPVIRKGGLG